MTTALLLQTIETLAVVVGVIFALVQLKQIRAQRDVQAALELLRPLQSPQTAQAVLRVFALPDNLDGKALRAELGDDFGSVIGLMAVFESLGPLVARGFVPIDMYAEFYRGATVLSWQKVRRYIEEERSNGWSNLFEWVQWLAERMAERSPLVSDVAAFERFRTWSDSGDYERLRGTS